MNDSMKQRHHVVIIGSGFGGLVATKALKDASVDVTVIAKTNEPPPVPAAALPVVFRTLRRRRRGCRVGRW